MIAAEPLPGEQVQGLRSLEEGFVPPVLDASVLDDRYLVSNRDAVIGVRRLMREEGIFAGLSSGAALHVALRVAEEMEEGRIVVLLADGGWKYLSTGLWYRDLDELDEELESLAPVVSGAGSPCRAAWPRGAGPCPRRAAERGLRPPLRVRGGRAGDHLPPRPQRRGLAAALQRASRGPGADHLRHRGRRRGPGRHLPLAHALPGRPSPTDRRAAMYPDAIYLLASLADPDATPDAALRAWRIRDGEASEVSLELA